MALVFIIDSKILDIDESQNVAIVDSRPSFLNLNSRKFETVKGLKFPRTSNNRDIFGFADSSGVTPTTLRSIVDVEMVIDGLIRIVGNLKITGNDVDYYIGTFTSRNSQIETLEGYKLDDAINLHSFDDTTFNALTTQQKLDYMTGNTDAAWVLPFIGAGASPYNDVATGFNNIIPYSSVVASVVTQDLWYSIGIAITEVLTDSGVNINVFESGSEVVFSSSDLYNNVISLLFTPTFYWGNPVNGVTIDPPALVSSRLKYGTSLGAELTNVSSGDIKNMGDKTFWEILVVLAKYLGYFIDVKETYILFTPFAEIKTNDIIDLSDKLVNERSKTYFVQKYEKNNYIRYNVNDTAPIDLGQLTYTQAVDYLKEEKTIIKIPIIIPGIYDIGLVGGFFRVNWDSKYAELPIMLFLDSGSTVSGYGEAKQGDVGNGLGGLPTTFYQLKFYSPTAEFDIIQDILDEAITIIAEFDLNIIDKYNIKPYSRVRVSQFSGTFVVEPFEWVKDKPTKLKLLKIE